ncbi:plasmid mobilization protein [Silvibacterium acidisoli]|uniref:plasmid mobilization protein n=1 Tax=Acidobacteriaceae bacterium ZG23-2 TaxID=2883246 RepID=UPI00406C2868
MKPPLRTKSVGTKVSEAEFAMLEERARASGLTLSEWVRDVLLAGPAEPGAELTGEVVLAELLALRSLFLNLQFSADKGQLSEPELRSLIERADATKLERARERRPARKKEPRARIHPRRRRAWRSGDVWSTRKSGRAGRRCGRSRRSC